MEKDNHGPLPYESYPFDGIYEPFPGLNVSSLEFGPMFKVERCKSERSKTMLSEENRQKCRKILDRYGYRPQMLMIIEECSELQKAVCKMLRNGTSATAPSDNFKEEIVDVVVMVTQACMIAGLNEAQVNAMAEKKLDRVLSRQ